MKFDIIVTDNNEESIMEKLSMHIQYMKKHCWDAKRVEKKLKREFPELANFIDIKKVEYEYCAYINCRKDTINLSLFQFIRRNMTRRQRVRYLKYMKNHNLKAVFDRQYGIAPRRIRANHGRRGINAKLL